jgi:hypothetical protein
LAPGFTGLSSENRLSYEHTHSFKTSSLAITGYRVAWANDVPVLTMDLNFRVKPSPRSGVIQCDGGALPVDFEPGRDPGRRELRLLLR